MAFALVGSIGTMQAGSAAPTTVLNTTLIAEVGRFVVVSLRMDNVAIVAGVTNTITSVTDSAGGNTWTKLGEYTQTAGIAGDGCTTAVFYSTLATQIPSGGTITVTHSSSGNRVVMADKWTAGGAVTQAGTTQATGASGTANPGSLTVSGLPSAAYLAYRAVGIPASSITSVSAGWTNMTGASGAGRVIDAESFISTATSFTSAPSLGSSQTSSSVMGVFTDAAVVASTPKQGLLMMGAF